MLKVLITIDTEAHAIFRDWKSDNLRRDIARDIEGRIDRREVGLEYQLDVLSRNGLRATFMVESLFAAVPEIGIDPLEGIVGRVLRRGHDVQLHPHCEWIEHCPDIGIPFRGHLQHSYSREEQTRLIRIASGKLQESGASSLIAFRAGGFSANEDTLFALLQNGVQFDSSYNPGVLEKCQLSAPPSFGVPYQWQGVSEVSVAAFRDYPGHWRPAQVGACSYDEMVYALDEAEKCQWTHFVIVSHSFEMLSGRWRGRPRVRDEVVERFEGICRYLSANRHKFSTVGFESLLGLCNAGGVPPAIMGNPFYTIGRMFEQGLNRLRG